MKKPEIIQLLEAEFVKLLPALKEKKATDLKNICKCYGIKGVTGVKKDVIIKTQIDTITRYNERVVYVEVDKDSISRQKDSISTQYDNLTDSLWKWALGPTLIYTQWPDTNVVYLMDLSEYYMATDDFGIIMVKMSAKEYTKYLTFKQTYGLPESAFWQFRTEMNIKRLRKPSTSYRKVWKYKTQWNKK